MSNNETKKEENKCDCTHEGVLHEQINGICGLCRDCPFNHSPQREVSKCEHYLHANSNFICPGCEHGCFGGFTRGNKTERSCVKCGMSLNRKIPSSTEKCGHKGEVGLVDGKAYCKECGREYVLKEPEWEEEFDERFDKGKSLDGAVFDIPTNESTTRRKLIKSFISSLLLSERKKLEEEIESMKKPINKVESEIHEKGIEGELESRIMKPLHIYNQAIDDVTRLIKRNE